MTHPQTLSIAWPTPGRYVLAVSGGADSMTLLDLMARAAGERQYDLSVAHVDHGLRDSAADDRRFVQAAAARYRLPFAYAELELGQGSETAARTARHAWLAEECHRHRAVLVTAHHQDDLLETSLLNLARGTGRRGLAPMQGGIILRPLLVVSRHQLRDYARLHQLEWREDPLNADLSTPRNLLRHRMLATAPDSWRDHYLELIRELGELNRSIDEELETILNPARTPEGYNFQSALIAWLSLAETAELFAEGIRRLEPGLQVERRLVLELALFAKTAPARRRRPVTNRLWLIIQKRSIRLGSL
jgi:tRNA(Ile)-lysidine synthase